MSNILTGTSSLADGPLAPLRFAPIGGAEPDRQAGPGSTSSLEAARAHARQQSAAATQTARTIPATAATDQPPNVEPSAVIWDETIGSGQYGARRLPRGTVLRVTDIEGDACTQLLVFNANRTSERFNNADTVKVQWQAYLVAGAVLLSDMGRAMMSFTADSSARHDCLCGGSNRAVNDAKFGDGSIWGPAPNSRDLLALGGAKYALGRVDIGPCLNLFKTVRVADDGVMTLEGAPNPGAYVELRSEMDVIVLLSNTPHPLDDRPVYSVSPIRVTAYRSTSTPSANAIRTSSPERQRAFENTDELFLETI